MKQYPTFRKLSTFGRRHRKVFVKGALSAAGVVAARLTVPWPLREIADTLSNTVPGSTEPGALYTDIFESAAVFLLAVVAIGLFDFLVRLWFSRFAIATTRDLRQAAFRNALGVDSTSRSAIAGDLVSRLIGDAARVKAGIQGFLVHVATNGLLFLGVTTILFIMSPSLGAIFCLIAVVTAAVTIWGARRLFKMSLLHREKEGQLANKIHSSLTGLTDKAKLKRINKSSGDYDASLTKLQGQITWATHAIFGVCIVVALAVSANSVLAGQLTSGDMVLFILYALIIRGPIVRLARQGTRTGKILGPATRLVQMLEPVPESATGRPQLRLRSLKKTLTLKRIKLDLPASGEATAITVGPLDLTIKRGQRVAIVDADGRAARALLDVIAGTRLPEEGRVVWDTAILKGNTIRTLESQVAVAENFPPTSSLALRLKDIAIALRRRASLRIFIDPANEMSQADADQVVQALVSNIETSLPAPTTIVALRHPAGTQYFDRIIHLANGRVVFDGASEDWRGIEPAVGVRRLLDSGERPDKLRVLFSGYAPVHFRCFRPLYDRLVNWPGVEVIVSGGVRIKTDSGYDHDEKALYDPFDLPAGTVLPVDTIREMDFDVLFSSHTRLILPRSVNLRIQIFHGISFRNKAVRPENMGCDIYFLVGAYMQSRFQKAGLLAEDDPRAVQVGFMKIDALVDGSLDRMQILGKHGFDGGRPVLLYAPTGAKQNSLETVGEAAIQKLLKANRYDLLIKPHDHPKNTEIDWPTYLSRYEDEHCRIILPKEDVVPYLYAADLLMSDASSVVNEFSLLDRPIVFLDTPNLLATARSANHSMLDLDTWGRSGGLVAETPDDICRVIEESLSAPQRLSFARQKMTRDLFFNPGRATDVAIEWLAENVLPASTDLKIVADRTGGRG